MEENVALDSSKQKKFVKSIKGIKKLIKKKDAEIKVNSDVGEKIKKRRVIKKKRKERGLVYLSHIPHGFYENEMTQYFKQFGVVTNARVIKSKRTGRSKGFAFVEFREPAVAQIVAETMNNYLMGKRLIKAAIVPPEKQRRRAFRKHWNAVNNPGNNLRIKLKKAYNENKDEEGQLKKARKLLIKINKTKKNLSELGINYDFFTPVDMPEALTKHAPVKTEQDDTKNVTKINIKANKKDKKNALVVEETKSILKVGKTNKDAENKTESKHLKENTKGKKPKEIVVNKKEQKQKKQNLKNKGVTPLEDFIKVEQDLGDESDSSLEFDSDEFDKMLEQDDDDSGDNSDKETGDHDLEDDESEDVESDDSAEIQLQEHKNKPKVKSAPQVKTSVVKQIQSVAPQPLLGKRKPPQKTAVSVVTQKKPKFEKQSNPKQRNKQFKKKK